MYNIYNILRMYIECHHLQKTSHNFPHVTIFPITTICHLDDWNCLSKMIFIPFSLFTVNIFFVFFFYFLCMFFAFLPSGCFSMLFFVIPLNAALCLSYHIELLLACHIIAPITMSHTQRGLAVTSEAEFLSTLSNS